jgi:hypothetical protein
LFHDHGECFIKLCQNGSPIRRLRSNGLHPDGANLAGRFAPDLEEERGPLGRACRVRHRKIGHALEIVDVDWACVPAMRVGKTCGSKAVAKLLAGKDEIACERCPVTPLLEFQKMGRQRDFLGD